MIPVTTFDGQTIAVFGLGLSGRASVRALLAGGARVVAWDDSDKSREMAAQDGIETSDLRDEDWTRFTALVLAPGVPLTHPEPHWTVLAAKTADVPVIGDTELFFLERKKRAPDAGVVAITGTNGKSTTTALTAHLLREARMDVAMGGNIGAAVLGLPDFGAGRVYVLELSSYQLDLTPNAAPNAAALLNITPDHIDRHGTIDHYCEVKSRIFANLGPGDLALISLDDEYSARIAAGLEGAFKTFDVSTSRDVENGYGYSRDLIWEMRKGEKLRELSLTSVDALRGLHNKQNAAFAWGLARHMGADDAALEKGLNSFPGLAHRMEIVARLGGHLIVNDSKATNADAAAQALSAFGNIYWIAGGRAKADGLKGLEKLYPRIRKAYFIGECASDFGEELDGAVPWVDSGTIEDAVEAALDDLRSEELNEAVLLLSPAAASFDQFANFEIRGDAFCDAVRRYEGVEMAEGRGA